MKVQLLVGGEKAVSLARVCVWFPPAGEAVKAQVCERPWLQPTESWVPREGFPGPQVGCLWQAWVSG